jgi:hypothetical protein
LHRLVGKFDLDAPLVDEREFPAFVLAKRRRHEFVQRRYDERQRLLRREAGGDAFEVMRVAVGRRAHCRALTGA